jgi:hypothetical protein
MSKFKQRKVKVFFLAKKIFFEKKSVFFKIKFFYCQTSNFFLFWKSAVLWKLHQIHASNNISKKQFKPLQKTSVRSSFRRSSGRMHCPVSTSARSCTWNQCSVDAVLFHNRRLGEGLGLVNDCNLSANWEERMGHHFWLNFSLYPRFPRFFYFKIADFFFPRQN